MYKQFENNMINNTTAITMENERYLYHINIMYKKRIMNMEKWRHREGKITIANSFRNCNPVSS